MIPEDALGGAGLDVERQREDAREHARHVAVDQGGALAVRDGRDGARGVRADARHLTQLFGALREAAVPAVHHVAGAAVQVPGAAVEAQARPGGEHVVERRPGQRRHGGEALHPALPVRDHCRHPRLLQHHLADPDGVRIADPAPRQIALHLAVALGHRASDLAQLLAARRHLPCCLRDALASHTGAQDIARGGEPAGRSPATSEKTKRAHTGPVSLSQRALARSPGLINPRSRGRGRDRRPTSLPSWASRRSGSRWSASGPTPTRRSEWRCARPSTGR